jgi:rhodanese-related sulfurtransferase
MAAPVDARSVKSWLSDGGEIAFLDVREAGQHAEGHPFFAVSLPYSRFELGLPALVPNPAVRLVLCDAGDGVAERAAARAEALGYRNVHIMTGGAGAWGAAGYTLYAGVNVPSKTFGELVEHVRDTPRVTARQLQAMREAKEDMVIVDGRTFAEFQRMSIPGGISCPNGELALRIRDIVPDPKTKIVVNCAGRTRSIIGAQTLIDLGSPNPVYALENGTQGWTLAGLALEHGATRRYPESPSPLPSGHLSAGGAFGEPEGLWGGVRGGGNPDGNRPAIPPSLSLPHEGGGDAEARARKLAERHGVAFVAPAEVEAWLAEPSRTTCLFDVRTLEEVAARPAPAFAHAPGGQLIQATDQWVGVRGARLVLLDDEEVRAPVVAAWLRQQGHEACVLEGGLASAAKVGARRPAKGPELPKLGALSPQDLAAALNAGAAQLIDLRPGMAHRAGHIPQARWSIRPRIAKAVADPAKPVVLVADEPDVAALAAIDLAEAGCRDGRLLTGGHEAWRDAGLPVAASPQTPTDAECIDFVFFTHGRHDGNAEAARAYLAWEIGLVDQLDAQERAAFRISGPA